MVLALLTNPKKLLFGLITIGIIVAVTAYAVSKVPAVSGLLAGTALAGMAASAFGGFGDRIRGGGGGGLLGGLGDMFSRDKKDNGKDGKGAADGAADDKSKNKGGKDGGSNNTQPKNNNAGNKPRKRPVPKPPTRRRPTFGIGRRRRRF